MNYDFNKLPVLGQGGFGVVYRADDDTALKVINVGNDHQLKTLALDEIDFLMKLNRQTGPGKDHIVRLTGFDELKDRLYVRMELAMDSMTGFMDKPAYGEITLPQQIDVMRQAFYGLEFLHSRMPPVIHQDVKPRNILLFPGLLTKLCDFGLSRSKTHTSITWADQAAMGTLGYTAPEVLVGFPVKTKMKAQPFSDVWSMSFSGAEWFSGIFPWSLDKDQDFKKQIKTKLKSQLPPDELCNVPGEVREVLQEGLLYDYSKRPSATEMRERLERLHLDSLANEVSRVSVDDTDDQSKEPPRDSGNGSHGSSCPPSLPSDGVWSSGSSCLQAKNKESAEPVKPTITLANGDRYTGDLKDVLPHGYGTCVSKDGTTYTGRFVEGKWCGMGTTTWKSGNKYVGQYSNNRKHGTGTYNYASGETYHGEFVKDKFHGKGTYTSANGSKYVGEFRDDLMHGTGTFNYASGATYHGEFVKEKFHGKGTYTWPDGRKYVGNYVNGQRHGPGMYTDANGKTKSEKWEHGVKK
eukprot:GHVU01151696.1.p1 GENE.GHVU01151696.1~~GHVU01151696.1.p1  ORF type:complete len:522 (+),score=45.32 GHVU01151696.1:178-1743(+)